VTRTLVRANTLLTQSARHGNVPLAGVVVEDGTIQEVRPLKDLEDHGPWDTVLGDPARHLVLPGFVNAHHHCYRPTRIRRDFPPLESWMVRLRERQLPPLSAEEVYDQTLWGTLQFVKSGVTSVVDYYPVDPRLDELGLPASVQAYLDVGLRATICLTCVDQNRFVYEDDEVFLATLPQPLADGLRQKIRPFDEDGFFSLWERFAARFDGQRDRIRLGLGPGGPQWCSDDLLRRVRRVADAHGHAPVQIHLLETRYQAMYGYRRYGHSAVQHLADLGFFGPATSCAHCVWVSGADVKLLADAGAVVVHNPSSNILLRSGIAPVADLLQAGAHMGFGLDGRGMNDTEDMLTDLRLGLLLQGRPGWDTGSVTAEDMLAMATHGGAEAIGAGAKIGRLEDGFQADMVLVDRTRLYDSPYVSPFEPVPEVILRRARSEDVDLVLVAGRPIIASGQAVGIDEVALKQRIAESLQRTYELLESTDTQFDLLEPHVAAFYRGWETESATSLQTHYQYNTR
jgi:cytosine/adenosine deaminase-related metal-dependent hydrolase